MRTFANSEDPDEMQHNAAFDQGANSEYPDEMQHNSAFHLGLHGLLRLKKIFRQKNTILFLTL